MLKPIYWDNQKQVVKMLDQTALPSREVWLSLGYVRQVSEAIRSMKIRGAPAIGIAAGYGMALAAREAMNLSESHSFLTKLEEAAKLLASTRPTAVNLFWAIERMKKVAVEVASLEPEYRYETMLSEALAIHEEDIQACKEIGVNGANLIQNRETIMTHCNAGALATGGYGSALGVLRAAKDAGKSLKIIVRETRPLLQGARLTAWELHQDGFDVTVITDTAAALLFKRNIIDRVIVGADRIAANGDTANKIGTYELAILAKYHGVAMHVAAPMSTIDFSAETGESIPLEQRGEDEVKRLGSNQLAPDDVHVLNPAFDITPAELITSIITPVGVLEPPYKTSIKRAVQLWEMKSSHRKSQRLWRGSCNT